MSDKRQTHTRAELLAMLFRMATDLSEVEFPSLWVQNELDRTVQKLEELRVWVMRSDYEKKK